MNLDQCIRQIKAGGFSLKKLQEFTNNELISKIFRLYLAYGEAKKNNLYDRDSLNWILSSLQEALKLGGFEQAYSLLETDVNASFANFWKSKSLLIQLT
jgi:hypothetical protein